MSDDEFRAAILAHLARIESALTQSAVRSHPTHAFYTVAEVLVILGMKEREFFTKYLRRFTDTRPVEKRTSGTPHRIRRSEVELVVERGWEALAEKRAAEARYGTMKKGKK